MTIEDEKEEEAEKAKTPAKKTSTRGKR